MDLELIKLPEYTPDYVVDEVKYYLTKIENNKKDIFTLDNALSLVNLAQINNKINEEQAENIKKVIKNIYKWIYE